MESNNTSNISSGENVSLYLIRGENPFLTPLIFKPVDPTQAATENPTAPEQTTTANPIEIGESFLTHETVTEISATTGGITSVSPGENDIQLLVENYLSGTSVYEELQVPDFLQSGDGDGECMITVENLSDVNLNASQVQDTGVLITEKMDETTPSSNTYNVVPLLSVAHVADTDNNTVYDASKPAAQTTKQKRSRKKIQKMYEKPTTTEDPDELLKIQRAKDAKNYRDKVKQQNEEEKTELKKTVEELKAKVAHYERNQSLSTHKTEKLHKSLTKVMKMTSGKVNVIISPEIANKQVAKLSSKQLKEIADKNDPQRAANMTIFMDLGSTSSDEEEKVVLKTV